MAKKDDTFLMVATVLGVAGTMVFLGSLANAKPPPEKQREAALKAWARTLGIPITLTTSQPVMVPGMGNGHVVVQIIEGAPSVLRFWRLQDGKFVKDAELGPVFLEWFKTHPEFHP